MAPGLARCRSFERQPTPQRPLVLGAADASQAPPCHCGELGGLDPDVERAMALVADRAVTVDQSSLLAQRLPGTADPHG